jgi:hypothetical protein
MDARLMVNQLGPREMARILDHWVRRLDAEADNPLEPPRQGAVQLLHVWRDE